MKRRLLAIGLAVVCTLAFAAVPKQTAHAEEQNYSYIYDWWGDVQYCPNPYYVSKTLTYKDFGLDKNFKNPESIYIKDDNLYICDTGNNRILQFKKGRGYDFTLVREITAVKGTSPTELSAPADVAVADNGDIFIADRGNQRILKVDSELNHLLTFVKPVDNTLDPELTYQPSRIVIDSAERVYASAIGINKGLIKYENDGVFSGFIGATPVAYDFGTYLRKRFATKEQLEQMLAFVPTEYSNVYMDVDGFIYAVSDKVQDEDLDAGKGDAVRKLNMLGSDILVRNGEYPVYGDLYWGNAGGIAGASSFVDVTVLDNEVYFCLDKKRCRIFAYDNQGRLVYVFGGNGNMDGFFRQPVSLEHIGKDLLVLDNMDNAVTVFTNTEFGSLVFKAMEDFDKGRYERSQEAWEKVMALDGNYTLAYIGVGRALLRQERYREAMDYFELKYDDENYSKAFQQYRKEWINDHIGLIIAILALLFLVPLGIGRYKRIKWEIATADIFREDFKK
ncbi:MAG: hypothetical protein ILP13_09405 [Lachnospiraceae bacterium]|nr:hypothetical protein [Lachnospiraceae bacterium]